jgi:penicillin-insensitive murein endopeptidase
MAMYQSKDGRGYFMLPQAPEGAGYYVYGTPLRGAGQYAHPAMLSLISWVEHRWQTADDSQFGIGNISLANGTEFVPHKSHRNGLQVDVRAVRLDGKHVGVAWRNAEYDRAATARLIAIFNAHPLVKKVYFNDRNVSGVFPKPRHDDHFHVEVMA